MAKINICKKNGISLNLEVTPCIYEVDIYRDRKVLVAVINTEELFSLIKEMGYEVNYYRRLGTVVDLSEGENER